MSKKQNNVGPNGRSVLSLRPLEKKAEKTLDDVSEQLTKTSQGSATAKSPIPKLSEPSADGVSPNLTFGEVEALITVPRKTSGDLLERPDAELPPTDKTEPSQVVAWDQIATVPETFSPGLRGSLLDRPETESLPPFTPPVKIESEVTAPQPIGYIYVIIHKTSVVVFEIPRELGPGRIKSIITSALTGGELGLDVVGGYATLHMQNTRELVSVKHVLDTKVEALNGCYHIWSKAVAEAVITDMVATGQWVKLPTNYMGSVDDKELCPMLRFKHMGG